MDLLHNTSATSCEKISFLLKTNEMCDGFVIAFDRIRSPTSNEKQSRNDDFSIPSHSSSHKKHQIYQKDESKYH